ncbi:MAG: ABC transporter ATP-binding protein [Bdellovibrionota bacterium]
MLSVTGSKKRFPPLVEIKNVSKRFSAQWSLTRPLARPKVTWALRDVSLKIAPSSVLALVGPNGSGKTTLLRILAGLLVPDEGELMLDGSVVHCDHHVLRELVSFAMCEERGFYWRLSARKNLEFFAVMYDLPDSDIRIKITEICRLLNIEPYLDKTYQELSAGLKQKLSLARALLVDAAIILADEPTRSLDPIAKRDVRAILSRLARIEGKTVVISTHDLHEARRLADSVAILNHGKLVKLASPADLFPAERHEELETTMEDLCGA